MRGKLLFFLIAGLVTVGILSWNVFGRLMDDHKLLGTEMAGFVILSFVVFGTIAVIFVAMFAEIVFVWLEKLADFKRHKGDPHTALKIYEVCLKLDEMLLDNVFRRVIVMGKVSRAFGDMGKERMARRISKEAETLKVREAQKNVDFRNTLETVNERANRASREVLDEREVDTDQSAAREFASARQELAGGEAQPTDLPEQFYGPEPLLAPARQASMTQTTEEFETQENGESHPYSAQTPQPEDVRHGRSWRTRSFQAQPQLSHTNRRASYQPQPVGQLPPHMQPAQVRSTPGYSPRAASEAVLRLSSVSVAAPELEDAPAAHRPVVLDSQTRKRLYPEPTPMESRAHHGDKPSPPKYASSWAYRYGFVAIFAMIACVYALDGSIRGAATVLIMGVILNAYWLHSNRQ